MWKGFPLFPESASSYSGHVDALYFFLISVSVFFSLLIATLIVVLAIRYRRRPGNERATQIEGVLRLELLWIGIPFVLVMTMFVWGARVYFEIYRPPDEAIDILVTAKQWMWKLQHPQGQREINALHVPVNARVRLTMASEDVIHSFYVPAFRMKHDVVPGRYQQAWFQATKTGEYHLFCAEYCGTKHSEMIGTVYVMEPADYEQWLSGAPAGEPPEQAGRKLFEAMRCESCHTQTSGARGPDLQGLFGSQVRLKGGGTAVADEGYVRESILEPLAKVVDGFEPVMPTYQGQLGEEQILQLIAYIKSLGGQEPGR
jgi:cytochrome c oxidase subunit II